QGRIPWPVLSPSDGCAQARAAQSAPRVPAWPWRLLCQIRVAWRSRHRPPGMVGALGDLARAETAVRGADRFSARRSPQPSIRCRHDARANRGVLATLEIHALRNKRAYPWQVRGMIAPRIAAVPEP